MIRNIQQRFFQPLVLPNPNPTPPPSSAFHNIHKCIVRLTFDISDASFIIHQMIDPWIRIFICHENTGLVIDREFISLDDTKASSVILNVRYDVLLNQETVILFEIVDKCNLNAMPFESTNSSDQNGNIVAWAFLKLNEDDLTNKFELLSRISLYKYQYNSWIVNRCIKNLGISNIVPDVYIQYLRRRYVPFLNKIALQVSPCWPSESNGEQNDNNIHLHRPNDTYKSNKMHEGRTTKLIHRIHNGGARNISFNHSCSRIAIVSNQNRLHIHDLEIGSETYRAPYCHQKHVSALEWCMDESYICCASDDGTISIHSLDEPGHNNSTMKFVSIGVDRIPNSLENIISPLHLDINPYMLVGSSDGIVSIWNLSCAKEIKSFQEHDHAVTTITSCAIKDQQEKSFDTNMQEFTLFSGDANGVIIFWRLCMRSEDNEHKFEVQRLRKLAGQPELKGKFISNLSLNHQFRYHRNEKLLITLNCSFSSLFVYDLNSHLLDTFGMQSSIRNTHFTKATFCSDGSVVLGGTKDGRVVIMDSSGIVMKVSEIEVFCL